MTTTLASPALDERLLVFPATSLARLGDAALLDRIDTKYIVPLAALAGLLDACAADYRALEVEGRRTFHYRTRYFDTDDLACYRAHLTGRLPRHKVRIRHYADAGTHVLELKHKTHRGRTQKVRTPGTGTDRAVLSSLLTPAYAAAGAPDPATLGPVVTIDYRRLTLVHATVAERVTIDLDYACVAKETTFALPPWAFVEVKQARRERTAVVEALRALLLRPVSVSKYCLGVAALVEGVPRHGYRRLLDRLAPRPSTHASAAHD